MIGDQRRGTKRERLWAIVGIAGAFSLYIVRGLFALGVYRRWQHGERDTPKGLINWGKVFVALYVFGFLFIVFVVAVCTGSNCE